MASAGRHSELQALVFGPQYVQFKPEGVSVTLYFSPEFMRKKSSEVLRFVLWLFIATYQQSRPTGSDESQKMVQWTLEVPSHPSTFETSVRKLTVYASLDQS